jgi:phage-related protein
MAIALKGDFIGFSFNEHRSEELGIVRVSDGSRYNEDLVPTTQDKTVQVPGGDGFYYFGSDYTQRQFSINIAFDELTEKQLRELQQVFGTKELGKLIFDERPYKYYMVKSGKPQLKYICFGREGEVRTYKGEGTLTFTAYYPFAKSIYKFLNEYSDKNKDEWKEASGMKTEKGTYDTVSNNGSTPVYNAGDLEADFILKFSFPVNNTSIGDIKIILGKENVGKVEAFLNLKGFSKKGADTGFQINTKTNLIEGFNAEGLTGTLYNENITQGDFFKIPPREEGYQISAIGATPTEIVYDYIYY